MEQRKSPTPQRLRGRGVESVADTFLFLFTIDYNHDNENSHGQKGGKENGIGKMKRN